MRSVPGGNLCEKVNSRLLSFDRRTASPFAVRRLGFVAMVQSAMLTGLEPRLFRDLDYEIMDRHLVRWLRALLHGKAKSVDAQGRIRSLTNEQVWKKWKLVPCRVEMLTRRLRWYQSWARRRDNSTRQIFLAVFGVYDFEAEPTVALGHLTRTANPWAMRFTEDMEELASICDEGGGHLGMHAI